MKVLDFAPVRISQTAFDNVVKDAPLPSETPNAIHTGFSLVQLLERSAIALNRNLENMLKCPAGVSTEQLQAKQIRSQMWGQQMRQSGMLFIHCLETLSMEQRHRLDNEQNRMLGELKKMPVPAELADAFDAEANSSNEFFDKLLALIDLIKNGYLAGYEHIIAAYSDFFADFNAQITAKLKDWVEGANDGKEVKLNAGALRDALTKLIEKYTHPNPASVLFPEPGKGGTSREEAENWRQSLGLPASCLKQNADGTYCVVIDTGPLWTMKNSLPSGGTVTWDTARFQAWQTGFNAQEERMKNTLQSFTQKYSNANSYHDNFNKTLSSHLNQFSDMLKAMLNF
jgi:invasin D